MLNNKDAFVVLERKGLIRVETLEDGRRRIWIEPKLKDSYNNSVVNIGSDPEVGVWMFNLLHHPFFTGDEKAFEMLRMLSAHIIFGTYRISDDKNTKEVVETLATIIKETQPELYRNLKEGIMKRLKDKVIVG